MGRMAAIQALRMIKALVRLGWTVARSSGSHHVLVKPGCPRIVVPVHRGKPLKEGTARGILKDVGVSEDEFFELY
jgi:predicted RNA binding protein YcfA (HicA-like mRNA interferase family)